jgi:hypothetical protein
VAKIFGAMERTTLKQLKIIVKGRPVMGPRPAVHERKGVPYQTVFDQDRGQFVERALPRSGAPARHPGAAAVQPGSAGTAPASAVDLSREANHIEIELAGGHRMRISAGYDPEALARLIRGLSA